MNYPKILYKNRERYNRGTLNNFKELPQEKQENFILIKLFLENYFKSKLDCYIWGSFNHGYWDEESDYDIIIYRTCDCIELDTIISKELHLKININCTDNKIGVILIP